MHRFRNPKDRTLHYLSSIAWLAFWCLLVYAGCLLAVALVKFDTLLAIRSAYFFVAVVLAWVFQRACASAVRCPLCHMRPMGASRCQKSPKSRLLLSSYRTKVAFDTLTQNHFRCPYCGESTHAKAGKDETNVSNRSHSVRPPSRQARRLN